MAEFTVAVRSLRLLDGGSFVDLDDEVADVLDDKEVVSVATGISDVVSFINNSNFCLKIFQMSSIPNYNFKIICNSVTLHTIRHKTLVA